jgi:hypothetical protein
VSQAASPISAAMSRIRLVVLMGPVAVEGRAGLLAPAGALSTGPFIVATGAVLTGRGAGIDDASGDAGTAQLANAMALMKTTHAAAHGWRLAGDAGVLRFFMSRCSPRPRKSANLLIRA